LISTVLIFVSIAVRHLKTQLQLGDAGLHIS